MQEYVLASRGIAYQVNTFVPGREVLVFIHGFSGSLSQWARVVPQLAEHYNLVVYDLRGHGRSARPTTAEGYALPEHVEDLRALLGRLNIRAATLVGYSFGSTIAMECARAYPNLVARAVFVSPVYGLHWRYLLHLTAPLLTFAALHSPRARWGDRLDYARYRGGDRSLRLTLAQLHTTGARSYFVALRQIYRLNVDAHWRTLTVPCLIVHGARDSIVPLRFAVLLKSHVPQARLIVVERGTHYIPLTHATDVAEAVRNAVENY